MGLWNKLFGRRSAPAVVSPGAARAAQWPALPPLQRALGVPELVSRPARFPAHLVTHTDPSFLSAPGHVVSAAAPTGIAYGLSHPEPAVAQRVHAELPEPSRPAHPVVARAVAPTFTSAAHAVELPARRLDAVAGTSIETVSTPMDRNELAVAPGAGAETIAAESNSPMSGDASDGGGEAAAPGADAGETPAERRTLGAEPDEHAAVQRTTLGAEIATATSPDSSGTPSSPDAKSLQRTANARPRRLGLGAPIDGPGEAIQRAAEPWRLLSGPDAGTGGARPGAPTSTESAPVPSRPAAPDATTVTDGSTSGGDASEASQALQRTLGTASGTWPALSHTREAASEASPALQHAREATLASATLQRARESASEVSAALQRSHDATHGPDCDDCSETDPHGSPSERTIVPTVGADETTTLTVYPGPSEASAGHQPAYGTAAPEGLRTVQRTVGDRGIPRALGVGGNVERTPDGAPAGASSAAVGLSRLVESVQYVAQFEPRLDALVSARPRQYAPPPARPLHDALSSAGARADASSAGPRHDALPSDGARADAASAGPRHDTLPSDVPRAGAASAGPHTAVQPTTAPLGDRSIQRALAASDIPPTGNSVGAETNLLSGGFAPSAGGVRALGHRGIQRALDGTDVPGANEIDGAATYSPPPSGFGPGGTAATFGFPSSTTVQRAVAWQFAPLDDRSSTPLAILQRDPSSAQSGPGVPDDGGVLVPASATDVVVPTLGHADACAGQWNSTAAPSLRRSAASPGAGGDRAPRLSGPSSELLAIRRLTASVQREQATAAESGGVPTTAPPEQGTEAEPAPPVTTTAVATPATASVETATPATTSTPNSPTEIDALVRKLYEPIVRKLKAEMRLDRERAGYGLDLAH